MALLYLFIYNTYYIKYQTLPCLWPEHTTAFNIEVNYYAK